MRIASVWPLMLAVGVPLVVILGAALADPPAPPALSKVVPPDDLVAQVDLFVTSFGEGLADATTYSEKSRLITRDAHTLAAIALVLAKHDGDHRLKAAAPALLAAARQLAKAKDYDSAQEAAAAVKAAAAGQGAPGGDVQWEKVAGLGQLMKQVTFVNNRLRRNIRRFDERKADNARDAAMLAVIAQASLYDTHEVKDPADLDKWYQWCGEMRDAAGALNAQIHAGDKAAAEASLNTLAKSCESCHQTFRVQAAQ